MIDDLKGLLITALLVAIIASVFAFLLPMVLGPLYTTVGFQTIIGGFIALVLLLLVAAKTDLDKMTFFNIILLFVAVGLIGSIITTVLPAASTYIISVENFANLTSIAWTLVYIGLAMFVKEEFL
jgi:hypothetical protein